MNLKTRDMILTALFAALTAIGAFIKIPIPYVPFTLQYFFCAFSGILLGARLGALSQLLYVAIGLLGLPVFTHGGGPSYIFQPTFGYLIGFIICSYVTGKLTQKIKTSSFIKSYAAILSGMFFMYLFGIIHLYIIFNVYLHKPKSLSWILFYGCFTVVGGDLVLGAIIAMLSSKIVPRLKHLSLLPDRN